MPVCTQVHIAGAIDPFARPPNLLVMDASIGIQRFQNRSSIWLIGLSSILNNIVGLWLVVIVWALLLWDGRAPTLTPSNSGMRGSQTMQLEVGALRDFISLLLCLRGSSGSILRLLPCGRPLGPGYTSVKNAALLTPSNTVFYRVKCFHMLFNAISLGETTRALLTPR